MRNQLSFEPSPQIFKHTQNFLSKINHLDPQTPNPQKILIYLLNHNFTSEQCYDVTQSKYQKQKLESEITFLRSRISDIIKSNQKVISLLQQRDEKVIIIQKLLNQRNKIDINVGLQAFRTKYKTKDFQLRGIKSLIPDKKTTTKDNLRYYRLTNKQFKQKIRQLKIECENIQKQNKILFEQQQIQITVNSQNAENFCERKALAMQQNQQYTSFKPLYIPESNVWIQKIEQIKQKHLKPEKQFQKEQIYQEAMKIHQSPAKKYLSPTKTDTIYSSRFWYNNLRDYKPKEKENSKRSISPKISQEKSSIYCCKSREKIHLNQNDCSERSLSRVKSLGSFNTTSRSNIYNHRTIYR